jgi:hypothetical protein
MRIGQVLALEGRSTVIISVAVMHQRQFSYESLSLLTREAVILALNMCFTWCPRGQNGEATDSSVHGRQSILGVNQCN